jgi:hypothetical protein
LTWEKEFGDAGALARENKMRFTLGAPASFWGTARKPA